MPDDWQSTDNLVSVPPISIEAEEEIKKQSEDTGSDTKEVAEKLAESADDPNALWMHLRHTLLTCQKYSAIGFTGFLGLHVINAVAVPAFTQSVDATDSFLLLAREVYRPGSFLGPILIGGSLSIHVLSGIFLRTMRIFHDVRWYGKRRRRRMSALAISGYCLLPFLSAHLYQIFFGPRYALSHIDASSNVESFLSNANSTDIVSFKWIAYGFSRLPRLSKVLYSSLIFISMFHVLSGIARYSGQSLKRQRKIAKYGLLLTVPLVISSLRTYSRFGGLRGYLGREYDTLYSIMRL